MRDALRAGIALFNAGHAHAAHDAWEDRWLDLDSGTDDERFLHGLIQYTAAVHHARNDNRDGCVGLAERAGEYLDGLPSPYRGVALDPVRDALDRLAAAPDRAESAATPLTHEGETIDLDDLTVDEAAIAGPILADACGLDPEPVTAAGRFARSETPSPFAGLLHDFLRDPAHRSLIHDRLRRHVERRQRRTADIDGLFE